MSKQVELTGVFGGIRWKSQDSDFVIGYLSDKTPILGDAPDGKLITGVEYRFSGIWKDDAKWGRQFKFDGFVQLQPHTRGGVVKYLEKHARGVGPAIASKLWDAYKTDAVKMLRNDPKGCASVVKGLTEKVACEAAEDLKRLAATEDTMIEIANLLNGRGFHGHVTNAVYDLWKARAPEVIARDPYKLLTNDIKSCGFGRVDRLYLDLGHDPGKLKRQCLCIWYLLHSDSSGSTWHESQSVYTQLGQQVGSTKLRPERATRLGVRAGWLSEHVDASGRKWLAERIKADQEQRVAAKINAILEQGRDVQGARGGHPLSA